MRCAPSSAARASVRHARCAIRNREVTGHGVTRTPCTIGTGHGHAPIACASEMPARSPAVVQVEPTASTIRAGGGSSPAAICSASSNAAASAPNVPTVVAPPGGITRSPRGTRRPTNGTSITERRRISGQPLVTSAAQFSIAHSDAGCGNTIAPTPMFAACACSTVATAWFEPYAPIAQIVFAPIARARPSQTSSVRSLLPPYSGCESPSHLNHSVRPSTSIGAIGVGQCPSGTLGMRAASRGMARSNAVMARSDRGHWRTPVRLGQRRLLRGA